MNPYLHLVTTFVKILTSAGKDLERMRGVIHQTLFVFIIYDNCNRYVLMMELNREIQRNLQF